MFSGSYTGRKLLDKALEIYHRDDGKDDEAFIEKSRWFYFDRNETFDGEDVDAEWFVKQVKKYMV